MAKEGHQEWLDPHKTEAAQNLAVGQSRRRLDLFHTWIESLGFVTLVELLFVVEQKDTPD